MNHDTSTLLAAGIVMLMQIAGQELVCQGPNVLHIQGLLTNIKETF